MAATLGLLTYLIDTVHHLKMHGTFQNTLLWPVCIGRNKSKSETFPQNPNFAEIHHIKSGKAFRKGFFKFHFTYLCQKFTWGTHEVMKL